MHSDVARRHDGADVLVEALAREAVRRDAIAHHAAELLAHLEHMHLMSHKSTEVCAGQARGATTHDSDLLARGRGGGRCWHLICGELVHRELFDAANVDRGVDERAATAILAWMLTHERARRGERIVLTNHADRPGIVPQPRKRDVGRHVHVRRAQRFARHCLRDAFATFSLLDVVFELFFERIEARKEHFGRMPADGTVGGVAHNRGLGANLVERVGIGAEREHLFEQRLDVDYALAARHALAARLASARTQQVELHRNGAHTRRRGLHPALILVQKRCELAVVFGTWRDR